MENLKWKAEQKQRKKQENRDVSEKSENSSKRKKCYTRALQIDPARYIGNTTQFAKNAVHEQLHYAVSYQNHYLYTLFRLTQLGIKLTIKIPSSIIIGFGFHTPMYAFHNGEKIEFQQLNMLGMQKIFNSFIEKEGEGPVAVLKKENLQGNVSGKSMPVLKEFKFYNRGNEYSELKQIVSQNPWKTHAILQQFVNNRSSKTYKIRVVLANHSQGVNFRCFMISNIHRKDQQIKEENSKFQNKIKKVEQKIVETQSVNEKLIQQFHEVEHSKERLQFYNYCLENMEEMERALMLKLSSTWHLDIDNLMENGNIILEAIEFIAHKYSIERKEQISQQLIEQEQVLNRLRDKLQSLNYRLNKDQKSIEFNANVERKMSQIPSTVSRNDNDNLNRNAQQAKGNQKCQDQQEKADNMVQKLEEEDLQGKREGNVPQFGKQ